jgi:DNA-binding response OmpR family regulator
VGRRDSTPDVLSGIHILLVDSDAQRRELVQLTLRRCGALVTEAESADAARDSLERITPELILWGLGFVAGRGEADIVQRVRTAAASRTRAIPIVALGWEGHHVPMDDVLEAGFAGYARAPFEPRRFCELLAEVVEAHPRGE